MSSAAEIAATLSHLSTPRPNGSRALQETVTAVQAWLEASGIPVHAQPFHLRPYAMELLGLWLALAGLLLPLAALGGWGWIGLLLALLLVAVPLLEVGLLQPTLTGLIRQRARNLIVSFPAPRPRQEMLLCAHLDSKTEPLDHQQRGRLLRLGPPAMGLALAAGLLIALEAFLSTGALRTASRWLAFGLSLPVAAYGLTMGINLIGGRFSHYPSTGAVDNGAAVAILLDLAGRLHRQDLSLDRTSVSLLFTVGEEAQMQGALAYVRDRTDWPLPVSVVNLEILGQDGGYRLWHEDGTALLRLPTDAALNRALAAAVEATINQPPEHAPRTHTDAIAFLRAGIPATTLASFDAELGERGFHSALDNPERVDPGRLLQAVGILSRFLIDLDASPVMGSAAIPDSAQPSHSLSRGKP